MGQASWQVGPLCGLTCRLASPPAPRQYTVERQGTVVGDDGVGAGLQRGYV